jgi:hypothetical protein
LLTILHAVVLSSSTAQMTREITVGNSTTPIVTPLKFDQAEYTRDALAKGTTFALLFFFYAFRLFSCQLGCLLAAIGVGCCVLLVRSSTLAVRCAAALGSRCPVHSGPR